MMLCYNCRDSIVAWNKNKLVELLIKMSLIRASGRTSEKSLSVSHLAVLLVLQGQTQETAPDKDMGVYNSKKPLGLVGVKEIISQSDRVSILALPSCSP